jgi:elongation factor P--beta-lysine ligase
MNREGERNDLDVLLVL